MWPTAKKRIKSKARASYVCLPVRQAWFLPLLLLAGITFSGCVATTTDIDRLQTSLDQVQRGQADLTSRMGELDQTINVLNEHLSENQSSMSDLLFKLDDTQTNLGGRMELISDLLSEATTQAQVAVPSEFYKIALGDYNSGKTTLALEGFQSFLKRYPDSDLADDAQFHLADCYLRNKKYKTARIKFDKVLDVSDEYRTKALLKRSYALKGMSKIKEQKHTLNTLIEESPKSLEAKTAREILKKMKPRKTKKKTKSKPKKKSK